MLKNMLDISMLVMQPFTVLPVCVKSKLPLAGLKILSVLNTDLLVHIFYSNLIQDIVYMRFLNKTYTGKI